MALDDRDIFLAICERFADQPIEFIMEQYEKAKKLNIGIEKRIGAALNDEPEVAQSPDIIVEEEVIEPLPAPKKRYTKRSLKVKPQDAITDDVIYCCICGEARQSLTVKHLAAHDISVEEYKKLCGYSPDTALMSHKRLEKSKEIIRRAQKARLDKRKEPENN